MRYVLDTHILIWYFIGSKRLKPRAREVIDRCLNEGGQLLVPTIVLAEALDIAEKGVPSQAVCEINLMKL